MTKIFWGVTAKEIESMAGREIMYTDLSTATKNAVELLDNAES